MTMRAVCYARVSSVAQRDRDTIASQLRVLPEYIRSQGWELAAPADTYVDDGHSAKSGKLDQRDGFARLLRDAEARRFDVVVVMDVDRLTRTDSMEERARILGPFQRNGIDIVTPSGGRLDLRTFLGELYVTMQALVAAEENRKRGERIAQGKLTAIQRGRKPSGPTPWGLAYDRETGEWSIDAIRGPIVREMFERVAAGESCLAIADDLHVRAVPRPRGEWGRHRVWNIVRSRYPVGEWHVDKRRGLVMPVPAIVDDQLWHRAQVALLRHKKRGLVRTKHVYLLEGLAVCGECGATMLIRSASPARNGRTNPAAYVCRARKLIDRNTPSRCRAAIAQSADVDARVWESVRRELEDPALVAALAALRADRVADQHDWQVDVATHRAHLARLERVERAVMERFRRGLISEAAFEAECAAQHRERAAVKAQLATAERAIGAALTERDRLEGASSLVMRLRAKLPLATAEQRRALVRALVQPGGATFVGRSVRVSLLVPRPPSARPMLALADASDYSCLRENHLILRVFAA